MTGRSFLLTLTLVLPLAVPGLAAQESGGGEAGAPVTIEEIVVRETPEATELSLRTGAEVEWLAQQRDNTILVELKNALPGPQVEGRSPGAGLIRGVTASADPNRQPPTTFIAVDTLERPVYSLRAGEGGLLLVLRPAPPAAAAGYGPAPGADAGEYRIGPGDALKIRLFGLDEFDQTARVSRDGAVSLPLLGQVALAGKTLREAETTLAGLFTEQRLVNDPQVTISVEEYVSRGISIQGAVENPGVYQMIEQRTLLDMLGEAGGVTGRDGNRAGNQIYVLRTGAGGEQIRLEVDAIRLIERGDPAANIDLRPGDVVMVPHAKRLRVYVSGAVEDPGEVEYLSSENLTVVQAITAAGGPTERANLRNVHVMRRLDDGTQQRIEVNVRKAQRGKADDLVLQPNDTVVVGEWFF